MTKQELIGAVATATDLTRAQAGEAIDAALEAISNALKQGEEVKLTGFGSFLVTDRPAGESRNPRTGEKVMRAASKAPKFRAGKTLKEMVNG